MKKLFIAILVSLYLIAPVKVMGASRDYIVTPIYSVVSVDNIQVLDTSTGDLQQADNTDAFHLCEKKGFIRLLRFLRTLVNLVTLVASIALVFGCIMEVVKAVMDEKADVGKALKNISGKIVMAVCIFLLPAVVHWIFFTDNFITRNNSFLQTCSKNMEDSAFKAMADSPTSTFQTDGTEGTPTGGGSYGSHESEAGYSHGGGGHRR